MSDLISRQAAIDALCENCETVNASCAHYPCKRYLAIRQLPSAQRYVSPLSREAELNECDKISRWARGEKDG